MIRLVLLLIFLPVAVLASPIRIKDLVEFDGVRGNDLEGVLPDKANWPVLTPLAENERGGSIMLRASSAQRAQAMVDQLREQELYCDQRDGVLRLSPGNVCTEQDVLRLCDTLQAGW